MRTNDGLELHSSDPEKIVQELHKLSMTPAKDDRAFMRDSADRVTQQTGRRVRSYNAAVFVADLLEVGLLLNE